MPAHLAIQRTKYAPPGKLMLPTTVSLYPCVRLS
jgi:hypothetical protein